MAITRKSVFLVRDELTKALKVLESFGFNASIDGSEFFKKIKFDIDNAEHVNSIALTIANYLSPEILAADGERSMTEQRKLLKDILDSLAYLSKVTGIKLDPKELNPDY